MIKLITRHGDTATEEELTSAVTTETDEVTAHSDTVQADTADTRDDDSDTEATPPAVEQRGVSWAHILAYAVLPGLALVLGLVAGYLKWMDSSVRASEVAGVETVQVAKDSTVALLSYKPDTVERDLTGARDLLTGSFRDSYTQLTNDVVIPGSKQKQITAVATVPAASSVSATANHAVVLVFVNQTTQIGQDAPTDSASSVRVTLDKVGDRWLVSGFDPV